MSDIVKLWTELKQLMENPDPKERGITQTLSSGKPIQHDQYARFVELSRDIGYDLSGLIREPKRTPEQEAENIKAVEVAKARCDSYVSPFQKFINEMMAQYVKDNDLSKELLDGETETYRIKYNETEKNYRYDSNVVELPTALLDHVGSEYEPDALLGYLIEQIEQSGNTYEYFDDMEAYDSEVLESSIEYEKEE
jgi:hypothetical protein